VCFSVPSNNLYKTSTITAMANETSNEYTTAVNNLMDSVGKIGQMQVDLVTNGIKSATSVFEPLGKTSIEFAGNVVNAINQVLQNLSSAIAPKK
jgi:chlorosome envelope protein B